MTIWLVNTYDAAGERTLKLTGNYEEMNINGQYNINAYNLNNYTLYTSPYMVVDPKGYTKHYYIESDRFVSKIGGGMANINYNIREDHVYGMDINDPSHYEHKSGQLYREMMHRHFDFVQVNDDIIEDLVFKNIGELQDYYEQERFIFFYHKDHLGSSTQISDRDANIIHHIEYMPTGEQFSEQRDYWATPYKFNSKELDAETGLYYYGARYYTPEIGIWLSVDPMADKYPSMSAYMYCAGNPVILVDPDGREIWITGDQASVAFNSMQQGTNLELKMVDGKIFHIGGKAQNDNDSQLLNAISSLEVTVQIETTFGVEDGEYHGTTYDESNQTAESTQRVNIYGLKGLEKPGAEGSGIIHEATEGYQMGLLSKEKKDGISRAGFTIEEQSVGAGNNKGSISTEIPENPADYELYKIGHGSATKAPNEMSRKEAINYKNPK